MMLPPPRLPTLPTACGIPTATCTPPNGISKSTVETYLLNAQKAKAILNLTYGADGTSPVTEAEYTDYVNNDCYYVETVQFPLVNYSSYSLATDDQSPRSRTSRPVPG